MYDQYYIGPSGTGLRSLKKKCDWKERFH